MPQARVNSVSLMSVARGSWGPRNPPPHPIPEKKGRCSIKTLSKKNCDVSNEQRQGCELWLIVSKFNGKSSQDSPQSKILTSEEFWLSIHKIRQTEMEKARRPMFQQVLDELRSKVRSTKSSTDLLVILCWSEQRHDNVVLYSLWYQCVSFRCSLLPPLQPVVS